MDNVQRSVSKKKIKSEIKESSYHVHYGELSGSSTESKKFKPKRYPAKDIFGSLHVECYVGNVEFKFEAASVCDVQLRIKSVDETLATLNDTERLSLKVSGKEVFAANVSTSQAKSTTIGSLVFPLIDKGFDVNEVKIIQSPQRLRTQFTTESYMDDFVPARYAEIVCRFVQKLRSVRQTLASAASEAETTGNREEIVQAAENVLFNSFVKLWTEAEAITKPIKRTNPQFVALKKFTLDMIAPEIADGPMWDRALRKPANYAGDFRIMEYAYERFLKTESMYGDAVHRLIADRMGACVRNRMQIAQDIILQTLAAADRDEVFRLTSIGSGSAREIDKIILENQKQPIEITLVDQEGDALDYVYNRVFDAAAKSKTEITAVNASFVELLRTGKLYDSFESQDIIYSLGLIDYFNAPTATKMITEFYSKLKPGGKLIICNMRDSENSAYWPLEYLCDWTLIYRNEADMISLADGCDGAHKSITCEESNLVYIMTITKPKASGQDLS